MPTWAWKCLNYGYFKNNLSLWMLESCIVLSWGCMCSRLRQAIFGIVCCEYLKVAELRLHLRYMFSGTGPPVHILHWAGHCPSLPSSWTVLCGWSWWNYQYLAGRPMEISTVSDSVSWTELKLNCILTVFFRSGESTFWSWYTLLVPLAGKFGRNFNSTCLNWTTT